MLDAPGSPTLGHGLAALGDFNDGLLRAPSDAFADASIR